MKTIRKTIRPLLLPLLGLLLALSVTACTEAAAERKATVAPKAFSQETEDTLALAAGLALTITFQ